MKFDIKTYLENIHSNKSGFLTFEKAKEAVYVERIGAEKVAFDLDHKMEEWDNII